MIQKTIHYCWFGGKPLPKFAEKCLRSWKKYCPDYEIVRWDESNFNVHCNAWCASMYEQKRWAFLSDYARLKIIYENGGVYLDTDVELVKSLDMVLNDSCFMGLDTTKMVNNGLGFGAEKNHPFIKINMDAYDAVTDFANPELNSWITTRLLKPYGVDCESTEVQQLDGVTIYPSVYFCAKHTHTGIITITSNTISIHHFDCSWDTPAGRAMQKERWKQYHKEYIRQAPKRAVRKWIGEKNYQKLKKFLKKDREGQKCAI